MSIRVLSWAFHEAPADLKPSEMLVLLALADAAADDGRVVFLGAEERTQEAIARKARMSRRNVIRMIDALVDRGLLERSRDSILLPFEYRVVVTTWHNGSDRLAQPDVTDRHNAPLIDGIRTVSSAVPASSEEIPGLERQAVPRKKPALPMPEGWAPNAAHYARARESRIDVAREAEAFRLHAETHDRRAANWNAAFTTWLSKARPGSAAPSMDDFADGDEWMAFDR